MVAVSLLSTQSVSRHFGGLIAVQNVDFDLPKGEIRALIGPNGAGKTTFVSMLCGRIPVSSGRIMFQGQDVTQLPAHKRIQQGTRVGLQAYSERTAGDMAYGHQRLLEVAMGLGQSPQLLILDEPTQGLSDAEVDDFITLIKEVAETTTVLLIEHNINVVMALADRITVMNFGEIIAEGSPQEIRKNDAVQTAYLGG